MSADIEQNKEIVEEVKEEVKIEEKPVEEIKEDEKSEEVSEKVEEKLSEEAEEKPVEKEKESKEEVVEEIKEEVKEEESEEIVKEPEEKSEKEDLSEEIKETKEELGLIKEVREELVCLYAKNKDAESEKEQLSTKVTSLETENADLKEQLSRYLTAEAEIKAKHKADRLESLSAKFKLLGQEKTVEQLSEKDDATIDEFETIVDAALDKSLENKEMPEVVKPSQGAIEEKPLSEEKPSEVETKKKPEQLTSGAFFANICKTLTDSQNGDAVNGKRVLEL